MKTEKGNHYVNEVEFQRLSKHNCDRIKIVFLPFGGVEKRGIGAIVYGKRGKNGKWIEVTDYEDRR